MSSTVYLKMGEDRKGDGQEPMFDNSKCVFNLSLSSFGKKQGEVMRELNAVKVVEKPFINVVQQSRADSCSNLNPQFIQYFFSPLVISNT